MSAFPGEATLVASWRALATLSPGAYVSAGDRVIRAVFPSWTPLNNAILQGPPSAHAADEAAAELARTYRADAVPSWALWLRSPLTDLAPSAAVREVEGMAGDTTTLVMTRTLAPGPGLSAAVVRTSIEAAGRASDVPVPTLPEPDGVDGLSGWAYVEDGVAVAGAWSHRHGTDCGLYAVGTVPEWRRRGIAATLVRHVLAHEYRRGARTASLQSTPMGVPLYRTLGFTPVGRYEEWVPRRRKERP